MVDVVVSIVIQNLQRFHYICLMRNNILTYSFIIFPKDIYRVTKSPTWRSLQTLQIHAYSNWGFSRGQNIFRFYFINSKNVLCFPNSRIPTFSVQISIVDQYPTLCTSHCFISLNFSLKCSLFIVIYICIYETPKLKHMSKGMWRIVVQQQLTFQWPPLSHLKISYRKKQNIAENADIYKKRSHAL